MYNPAGFDDTDLISDPQARQRALPGGYATQGEMVSGPYRQANMMAAEKTNSMNAISQEPGKAFLDQYMQKAGMEQGETANIFNALNPFGGTQKAVEAGDRARRGEDPQVDESTPLGSILNRNARLEQLRRQMGM